MRARIDCDTELYPATVIRFPADGPWDAYDQHCSEEVPDEAALRWKAARDAWRAAQEEIEQFLAERYPGLRS